MKKKENVKSKVATLAIVAALVMAGTPHCLASEDAGAIAVDAVLVRPACFVSTIVGSALFVISLPIAATSKSVHKAARALVIHPAQATFTRPLGDLDDLSFY